ncbi:hypothetical protein E5288_WYG005259 [Bos mutus]|uniref:Tripartite motif-containing protein 26 n=1 Tax=Bos mutus TaxID=72004 RepID=A0A6B0SEU0_9CETA|nr:hypothetical protein [Bos mutus]
MAASAPLRSLEEEVTCSICLDYLRDPVTIDCGHVFCRSCTTDIRSISGGRPVCPLCKKPFKKENIRPVWQLASLVENIERLKVDRGRQPGEAAQEQADVRLCERHREKLHYYCEDDGKLLCVMCRESREHRPHSAVLVEKAAQPHREKILNHLSTLRRDRDKIQGFQAKGEADILAALKLQDQRQCIVAEFEQGHQFLREREQHLLGQLAKLEQELTEGREKFKTRGVGELARLAQVISELEGKAQQPAAELMQELSNRFVCHLRYPRKKFWIGKPIARVVKKKTGEFSDKLQSLQRGLREFQGKLLRDLEYKTVSVTLDPQSASGYLQLSEDWKCVTYSGLYQGAYLYPQQFDCEPGVLGTLRPRRVGIALDYEGGTVTFTNAESQELIYTFTATFTRRLLPFLWLKVTVVVSGNCSADRNIEINGDCAKDPTEKIKDGFTAQTLQHRYSPTFQWGHQMDYFPLPFLQIAPSPHPWGLCTPKPPLQASESFLHSGQFYFGPEPPHVHIHSPLSAGPP